jgi:hypothetical protein
MHQAACGVMSGDDSRHVFIVFQAPDIIDHIGACPQRGFCYRAFVSID